MQLFYQPRILEKQYCLDPEESRHCIKVLRKIQGDTIDITDGKGSFYQAKITQANPKKCEFEIVKHEKVEPPDHHIHIAIAPTKNMDRLEWFVEKCIEIGIDELSFFISSNSERKVLKTDRIQKKGISAMKQSMKPVLPQINEVMSFQKFVNSIEGGIDKFIAYVDNDNPDSLFQKAIKGRHYCILVGPEGDFTKEELETAMSLKFRKVNLGNSRLRTETAGVVACHTLNLINAYSL